MLILRRAIAAGDASRLSEIQIETLGSDFDHFAGRGGRGNRCAILFETFKVKFDGFMDRREYFFPSLADRDTAWKIGYVGAKRRGALFNDN